MCISNPWPQSKVLKNKNVEHSRKEDSDSYVSCQRRLCNSSDIRGQAWGQSDFYLARWTRDHRRRTHRERKHARTQKTQKAVIFILGATSDWESFPNHRVRAGPLFFVTHTQKRTLREIPLQEDDVWWVCRRTWLKAPFISTDIWDVIWGFFPVPKNSWRQ